MLILFQYLTYVFKVYVCTCVSAQLVKWSLLVSFKFFNHLLRYSQSHWFFFSQQTYENPPSVSIHSTALVDEGATIGAFSRVWHWVHVCPGLLSASIAPLVRMFLWEIACVSETTSRFRTTCRCMTTSPSKTMSFAAPAWFSLMCTTRDPL